MSLVKVTYDTFQCDFPDCENVDREEAKTWRLVPPGGKLILNFCVWNHIPKDDKELWAIYDRLFKEAKSVDGS